jgi:hypothetical protein
MTPPTGRGFKKLIICPLYPPLAKGGKGGFREIVYKIPLNPPFSKGEILKGELFHPRLQNGVFKVRFS